MATVVNNKPALAVEFCALQLDSPIVLLSGCVGFGEEYTRIKGFSNCDAGAIVLKGTTRQARLGNPPHRVSETSMGMLNAIGLQNPGVDRVVDEILPTLDFSSVSALSSPHEMQVSPWVWMRESAVSARRRPATSMRVGASICSATTS